MRQKGVGSPTLLHPGAHPLIIYASSFTFLFFLVSYFLRLLFHFFLCAISLLRHLSPLRVPCNATDGLCERWEDHRGFLSIWPQRALHLPLTAWSITHKCFLLLFGSRFPAQGSARLSELLSSLPWASAGNKSTVWICISSVSHQCQVHSTSK